MNYMSLGERWIGAELSGVERELACNPRYEDIGFVEYYKKNPHYFYLHPSPFLKAGPPVIYTVDPAVVKDGLPPRHRFIEAKVTEEIKKPLDSRGKEWLTIKEVGGWKEFDIASLARQRKIMDYEEVIEYFTYPYDGEAESIEEIAGCSALFSFSSPAAHNDSGGIRSAVFGKKHQWDLFRRPFDIIPREFQRADSYYYYKFSQTEGRIRKADGEINHAVLRPQDLVTDIPVAMDRERKKSLSQDYRDILKEETAIVRGQLIDGLLITPQSTDAIEKAMQEAAYELRDDYLSSGQRPFRQNISGAIPHLASSYARLQSSDIIEKKDIRHVMDLWATMLKKTERIQSSPLKVQDAFSLTGDARVLYYRLYDVFGADSPITYKEALKAARMDPVDFRLSCDSLEERGYCLVGSGSLTLLEPYRTG